MSRVWSDQFASAVGALVCALGSVGFAQAESRCWPEQALIGQSVQAYVWGSPHAASAPVPTYSANGASQSTLSCDALAFQRATASEVPASCGDESAFLPLEWSTTVAGLARARLRSGGFVWLKPTRIGEAHAIVTPDRIGTLLPADTAVRIAPELTSAVARDTVATQKALIAFIQSISPSPASTLAQALTSRDGPFYRISTAQKELRNPQGTWIQVTQRLVYSSDEGLTHQDGPALASGYFLYRNAGGVVQAVLEDVWCD